MNLNSQVSELPSVGPIYQKRLEKLQINNINDLLMHVPHRYLDFRHVSKSNRVRAGEMVTLQGKVASIKNVYTRFGKKFQLAKLKDKTGEINVVWFNQPFLINSIFPNETLSLAGKVGWFGRQKALISPEYEKIQKNKRTLHTARLVPVYAETSGLSSKWLRGKIKSVFENIDATKIDPAFYSVHFPTSLEEAQEARKKLAFDELLELELKNLKRRALWRKNKPAFQIEVDNNLIKKFIDSLPFKLTDSQQQAIEEILSDLQKDYPMNRLLEGDVGSGKTIVAVVAIFAAFINGYQSVYMAPTQILAEQHFNTLNLLLQPFKVRVKLITSGSKKGDLGRNDIFIGTHALIQKKMEFDKVALVIIDEQHRFGVKQRELLVKKSGTPHILSMTATPIPRTIAQTLSGDLDLSTLNELPAGRKKITTWIVSPAKRKGAYQWIEQQITKTQSRAFLICPLIEESQKETMKDIRAVTSEFKKLKLIFPHQKLGLLHGRLKTDEKTTVLNKFRLGKIQILVATPVVEVGIDIPKATIMVIEAAERFGLAEMHQLRGRVGRSESKSFCLLFSETKSEKAIQRLSALQKTASGFELAELDLKLRGPGEIYGLRQHGFLGLKIASWTDTELMQKAKKAALKIFQA